MGWKGALRTITAELRRQEREAARRARAAAKNFEAAQRSAQKNFAAAEVEVFESHIDELTSMHRECVDALDWTALLDQPLPSPPRAPSTAEPTLSDAAQEVLSSHDRSFFGRLFGSKRRLELEGELVEALDIERATARRMENEHQRQLADHARAVDDALETRELAARVLAGDLDAQSEVVQDSGCLHEVATSIGQTHFELTLSQLRATITLRAEPEAVVPAEQKTLTAKGTISRKKFSATRKTEIYEDYVCGAALRVAREIMAVIPTPAVLVHVESTRVEPSTGHMVPCVILSALVPRETIVHVDWTRVDASELVATLHHHMKMKRGKGFEPIQKLTFSDR